MLSHPLHPYHRIEVQQQTLKQPKPLVLLPTSTDRQHLVFPQALVQGALARLGMAAYVTAETSGLPQCKFRVGTS